MRTAHDIIAMLPDDVHAEVIEGEVIVNAATPAGRHARIVLAVRRITKSGDPAIIPVARHPGHIAHRRLLGDESGR